MKLAIISDIHNEFHRNNGSPFVIESHPDDPETVLVLAGDIDVGAHEVSVFLNSVANQFKATIYLAGNHEHYHHDMLDFHAILIDKLTKLGITDKVHFLDNSTITLDGVKFVGGTLWTDFNGYDQDVMLDAKRYMHDYSVIRYGGRKLTPEAIYEEHRYTRAYIDHELSSSQKTVVVTHHAPSFECVHTRFLGSGTTNHMFYSNLSELLKKNPALWIHGHMHDRVDQVVEGTRIVANPNGYPNERSDNANNQLLRIEI